LGNLGRESLDSRGGSTFLRKGKTLNLLEKTTGNLCLALTTNDRVEMTMRLAKQELIRGSEATGLAPLDGRGLPSSRSSASKKSSRGKKLWRPESESNDRILLGGREDGIRYPSTKGLFPDAAGKGKTAS